MENVVKSGEFNFTIRRGEYDVQQLLNWTVNGSVFNLDQADEIRVDFRLNLRNNGMPELTLSKHNGGLNVFSNNLDMIFGTNTLNLKPGIYYYDVLVVMLSKRLTWVKGCMILEDVVTR